MGKRQRRRDRERRIVKTPADDELVERWIAQLATEHAKRCEGCPGCGNPEHCAWLKSDSQAATDIAQPKTVQ